MSALADEFVEWAWDLVAGDIPPEAIRAARRHLLDGWGCALAAARLGTARPALEVACQATSPEDASVPGLSVRLPVSNAAFALGALVHALDFDDTHPVALVHPTAMILPVLSAVGQLTGADSGELETAAICGYEFIIRLGAAVPHGFHARGFHATSVCGVFAATLVTARLLGLSHRQAVSALGIAGLGGGWQHGIPRRRDRDEGTAPRPGRAGGGHRGAAGGRGRDRTWQHSGRSLRPLPGLPADLATGRSRE